MGVTVTPEVRLQVEDGLIQGSRRIRGGVCRCILHWRGKAKKDERTKSE